MISLALVDSGIHDEKQKIVLMILMLTTWKANSAECLGIYSSWRIIICALKIQFDMNMFEKGIS